MDAFTHCVESYLSTTVPPDLRRDRPGGAAARLPGAGSGRPRRRRTPRRGGPDDGRPARAASASTRGWAWSTRSRTPWGRRGGRITGRSTRSCCRTPCGSTARRRGRRLSDLAARLGLGRSGEGPAHLITLDRAGPGPPPPAPPPRRRRRPPPRPDRRVRPPGHARPLPPHQPPALHPGRHGRPARPGVVSRHRRRRQDRRSTWPPGSRSSERLRSLRNLGGGGSPAWRVNSGQRRRRGLYRGETDEK